MPSLDAIRSQVTGKRLALVGLIAVGLELMNAVNITFSFSDNWPRLQGVFRGAAQFAQSTASEYGRPALGFVLVAASLWLLWRDFRHGPKGKINRHYKSDLEAIDGKWLLDPIMGSETVLIVVGSTVAAELLDRPAAARIRDEIDRIGKGHARRRGLVITHSAMVEERRPQNRELLKACPVISIGGDEINAVTKDIRAIARAKNEREFMSGTGHAVYVNDSGIPKAAIWGDLADETESSVASYIYRDEGLQEFLDNCWNRPRAARESPIGSPPPSQTILAPSAPEIVKVTRQSHRP